LIDSEYPSGPVLLDTEVFIWAVMAPEKLSVTAKRICSSTQYQLHASVATLWEIVTKVNAGKLPIPDPVGWFARHVRQLGAPVLSIKLRDIEIMANLPWIHKDPFDRVIMAQANAAGYPLITCDQTIRRYDVRILW
jgi:PIN domain nuclease of toxin-antitoxin system